LLAMFYASNKQKNKPVDAILSRQYFDAPEEDICDPSGTKSGKSGSSSASAAKTLGLSNNISKRLTIAEIGLIPSSVLALYKKAVCLKMLNLAQNRAYESVLVAGHQNLSSLRKSSIRALSGIVKANPDLLNKTLAIKTVELR
jgi:hypothetical protein